MGLTQWLPIQVSQLELGLPLRYDIFTEAGDRIANAGDEFTQTLRKAWQELGIETVRVRLESDVPDEVLLRPYNQQLLQRLEENLELTSEIVFELAARKSDKHVFTNMEFQELTTRMIEDIQSDSTEALLTLYRSKKEFEENDRALADRSSKLSLLSMVLAREMGMSIPDCYIAGTAGMLHDISLMGLSEISNPDDQVELYRQHPLKSAYAIDTIAGINPKVSMAVAQVHESPDGTGFPRELHQNRIMPVARVINLADVYITLTSTAQPIGFPVGRGFHPADAIGYIMYHTARGVFEIDAVRALIRAASLYPIGSSVTLSDNSTAIVYRSSRIAPSKPIVRLAEEDRLVDLRQTDISILGPNRERPSQYEVLRRSQLGQVMWV